MLKTMIRRVLPDRQKRTVKTKVNEAKQFFVRTFLSYDAADLKRRLASMGIVETDTVLVHANFKPDSGFKGGPLDLVNAFAAHLGRQGNLLMVSIPFRGTAYDCLAANKPFNVKKTMSMMGLATEMFRRAEGTLRSLHPTHPVLARGREAEAIVAGHEKCIYPCGPGSPFERLHELKGKILFFDVGMESITFFHYVEHLLQNRLPFPVYDDRLFTVAAIDANGETHTVQSYAFSRNVVRRADRLREEMLRRGLVRIGRIGNSRLLLVTAEDVVTCMTDLVERGHAPYDWHREDEKRSAS
jgi:aminoglycoside 3-N-acetyltransferase